MTVRTNDPASLGVCQGPPRNVEKEGLAEAIVADEKVHPRFEFEVELSSWAHVLKVERFEHASTLYQCASRGKHRPNLGDDLLMPQCWPCIPNRRGPTPDAVSQPGSEPRTRPRRAQRAAQRQLLRHLV